jgi:hypothetical protein
MGDIPRIGPRPVPDDESLSEFLDGMFLKNEKVLQEKMGELRDTITETLQKGEPRPFAYAKLLNYLNAQDYPQLVYLCAAAMWQLNETDKDGA